MPVLEIENVMKLTTKGRYAVTALLDLALHQQQGPTTVAEVAERHGISATYLERLAGLLRAKGLLKSVRGPRGGYVLARSADQITVAEIIEAVDEKMDATRCAGKANCHEGSVCLTHHLWDELNHQITVFLQGITLSALAKKSTPFLASSPHKQAISFPLRVEHA